MLQRVYFPQSRQSDARDRTFLQHTAIHQAWQRKDDAEDEGIHCQKRGDEFPVYQQNFTQVSLLKGAQPIQRADMSVPLPEKKAIKKETLRKWVGKNADYTAIHEMRLPAEKKRLRDLLIQQIGTAASNVDEVMAWFEEIFTDLMGPVPAEEEVAEEVAESKEKKVASWTTMGGKFTSLKGKEKKGADNDLSILCDAVKKGKGNIYSTNIQTVAGGHSKEKEKYGLAFSTSRIDVQIPLSEGVYNLQYQLGNNSICGVFFTDEDTLDQVMDELMKAFAENVFRVSPSANAFLKKRR